MYRIAISGRRSLGTPTVRLVDEAIRAELARHAPDVSGISYLAYEGKPILASDLAELGGTLEAVIAAAQYREGLPAASRSE